MQHDHDVAIGRIGWIGPAKAAGRACPMESFPRTLTTSLDSKPARWAMPQSSISWSEVVASMRSDGALASEAPHATQSNSRHGMVSNNGLSKQAQERCHQFVYVPSKRCLNLAAAGAILMYDRAAKEAG